MQAVTRERLLANAYRVLGLPAGASQAAIEQAARRMRIWPDPSRIPPTSWDLLALGPLSRTKNEIEQAVSRLSEPESRIEERLLWFHADTALPAPGHETPNQFPKNDPAAVHDAALASFHAAMLSDPSFTDLARWEGLLGQFARMADSPEQLAWLVGEETGGEFEKCAADWEIASALRGLPAAITNSLVSKAEESAEAEDLGTTAAILALLRRTRPADISAAEAPQETRLLNRVEDILDRRCRQMQGDLKERIKSIPTDSPETLVLRLQNTAVCRAIAKSYNASIDPVYHELESLCASEPDRLERVRANCAKTMTAMANGWWWADQCNIAEQTFNIALVLATGTTLERPIRDDLARLAPRAKWQREQAVVPGAMPGAVSSPAPARSKAPAKRTGAGWAVSLVAIVVGIISGLFSSNRNQPTTPSDPLPNINIPSLSPDVLKMMQETSKVPSTTPSLIGNPSEFNLNPYTPPKPATPDEPIGIGGGESGPGPGHP